MSGLGYDPKKVTFRSAITSCPLCLSRGPCEHFCDRCGWRKDVCTCEEGPDVQPPTTGITFTSYYFKGTCIGCGKSTRLPRQQLPSVIRDVCRWISIECECGFRVQLEPQEEEV